MRKMWSGRPPGAQTAKREVLPPMSARRTLVIERETPPIRTNAEHGICSGNRHQATRNSGRRAVAPEPGCLRSTGSIASALLRIHIEPGDPSLEPRPGGGIACKNQRVVAGHHVAGRARELLERRVALDDLTDIVGDRKHAAAVDMGVEMRRIGREHHVAAPGLHAYALQSLGMAADVVDR